MTNMTLDAAVGMPDGHLRLHAPALACPYREAAATCFPNFDRLNVAFQQATGWSLGWYETAESHQTRVDRGRPDYPAAGQLAIEDLSTLLPPGVPAVSRIYCEKLVAELNETINPLQQAQVAVWQHANSSQPSNTAASTVDGTFQRYDSVPGNAPLHDRNLGITPLTVDAAAAMVDWHVANSGTCHLLVAVCPDPSLARGAALLTARTTFLAECRHESTQLEIESAIRDTLDRQFPGDMQIDLAIASVNPLTGQFSLTGDEAFRMDSSSLDWRIETTTCGGQLAHLTRSEHLIISHWPRGGAHSSFLEEVDEWWWTTIRDIRKADTESLAEVFQDRLENSIPSLLLPPNLAVGLSR